MLTVRLHVSLVRDLGRGRLAEAERVMAEYAPWEETRAVGEGCASAETLEVVRLPEGELELRLLDRDGAALRRIRVDGDGLRKCFAEYHEAIRAMEEIGRTMPAHSAEAIEYARRVVHDESALWLRKQVRPDLDLSLHNARGLFTLIFVACAEQGDAAIPAHRL